MTSEDEPSGLGAVVVAVANGQREVLTRCPFGSDRRWIDEHANYYRWIDLQDAVVLSAGVNPAPVSAGQGSVAADAMFAAWREWLDGMVATLELVSPLGGRSFDSAHTRSCLEQGHHAEADRSVRAFLDSVMFA